MTEKCGVSQGRFQIVGPGPRGKPIWFECLRTRGHVGPHLIQLMNGQYIAWEHDLCPEGECDYCDGDDPHLYCLSFWEVNNFMEISSLCLKPEYEGI